MAKKPLGNIDERIAELIRRDSRFEGMDRDLFERHLRLIDEIDRLAARRAACPTREEFVEFKAMVGQRLDPLEAAVRQHSVEIERLKRNQG